MNEPIAVRRPRVLPWLWLGTFFFCLCFAHGNIESLDSGVTMHAARALWLRGDSGLRRSGDGAEWFTEGLLADHMVDAAPNGFGRTGKDGKLQYAWFPIGHVWLLVLPVAIGEWLERAFPQVEAHYRALPPPSDAMPEELALLRGEGEFALEQGAVALLIPPAVGACVVMLVFLLAQRLGCSRRQALLVAASVLLATQSLSFARETISNGCGLVFLLAALLGVIDCHRGTAGRATPLLAGMAAGAAVLCRYQQAAMLLPLGALLAWTCWRRRAVAPLLLFALGGAPFLGLMLATGYARFGDPFATGYPPLSGWAFNYPIWLGLPRMWFAASKGIFWLSPLLWLVVPIALRVRSRIELWWLPWSLLLLPMGMFAALTGGWQSGQCWSSRYVTDGIVVFSTFVLAATKPWQQHRRWFLVVFVLGCVVNLTGIVAPVRGHAQLAKQATLAKYEGLVARGDLKPDDLRGVFADVPDHFYQEWQFSVLHANWRYAWQSATGAFEDENGRPRNGIASTIGAVFSVHEGQPIYGNAPRHWEDRNFRHLWWKFWGDLLGMPWWPLLLLPAVLATAMLRVAWRRLSRD